MNTTHTFFYISPSYLESENEVLKYVLHIPLQRQIQDIILG